MELSFYKDYKKITQLVKWFIEFQRKTLFDNTKTVYYEKKIKQILFSEEQKKFEYDEEFLLYRNPIPVDLAYLRTKVIFTDPDVIKHVGFSYNNIINFLEKLKESKRVIWYHVDDLTNDINDRETIMNMVDFWSLKSDGSLKDTPIIKTREYMFLVFDIDYLVQYNHLILGKSFYKNKKNGYLRQKISFWFEREIGKIMKGFFGNRSIKNAWIVDTFNEELEEVDNLSWTKNKDTIFIFECKSNFLKTGKETQTQRRLLRKPIEQLNRKKEAIEFSLKKDRKIHFRNGKKVDFNPNTKIVKVLISMEEGMESFYKSPTVDRNDIVVISWGALRLFSSAFDEKEQSFVDFVKQIEGKSFKEEGEFVDGEFVASKYLYSLDINKNETPNVFIDENGKRIVRSVDAKGLFRRLNPELLSILEKLEVAYAKGSPDHEYYYNKIKEKLNAKNYNKVLKDKNGFST